MAKKPKPKPSGKQAVEDRIRRRAKMFWKKKEAAVKPTEAKAEPPKSKEKKLSPKDIIVSKIEQLSLEQTISYRLPETYGGGLVVVELNPEYPAKGRMYILSTEKIAGGKPIVKRGRLWDSDKPKDIASWIIDRGGELFSSTEEGAISSQVTMLTSQCKLYKEVKKMFWKKKQAEAKAKEAEPQKAKKLSPKEVIMGQIERLGAGQTLMYRLRSAPAMGIAVIELNPEYPGKGKKYTLSTDKIVEDKPAGKRSRLWDYNKATDIAKWIMERGGELYSATEESVTSSQPPYGTGTVTLQPRVKMAKKKEKKRKKAAAAKVASPPQPSKPAKKQQHKAKVSFCLEEHRRDYLSLF